MYFKSLVRPVHTVPVKYQNVAPNIAKSCRNIVVFAKSCSKVARFCKSCSKVYFLYNHNWVIYKLKIAVDIRTVRKKLYIT